jgi:hypothetical protein
MQGLEWEVTKEEYHLRPVAIVYTNHILSSPSDELLLARAPKSFVSLSPKNWSGPLESGRTDISSGSWLALNLATLLMM